MRLFIIILFFTLKLISFIYSSSTSTSGATLLKQFAGSRAPAMGEAFTAVSDDIYALHYNPAGLVKIEKEFSAIYYKDQTVNFNYGLLAYGQSFNKIGVLAGSLFVYDSGKIEFEDDSGNLQSFNMQRDYLYTLGFARNIVKSLSLGVNLRLYSSTIIEQYNAKAYSMDIGTLCDTPVKGLSFGVVMQNMGTPMKYIEEKDPLPATLRIGTAYRFQLNDGHKFIVSADIVKPNDSDIKKNFGTEFSIKDLIYLRAGYKMGYDLEKYSFGVGIRLSEFRIDYGAILQKFLIINPISVSWKKDKNQEKPAKLEEKSETISPEVPK
ncbi:MAG: hypothetical protein A2539_10640 [Elusimicrobia bacterium RIFOXYD2_FULL_34_15]|nr:MAG: hypothetical protein A2539_10640 [Elusimicrobia bacterium RIFOXYD2_FULL_34_15]